MFAVFGSLCYPTSLIPFTNWHVRRIYIVTHGWYPHTPLLEALSVLDIVLGIGKLETYII